jgi:anti-sigma B factor antagonist
MRFIKPPIVLDEIASPGTIVSLVGEFDLSQRALLQEAFEHASGQATVIVDFTWATYIDSTVLGCLIGLRKNVVERGGALTIVLSSSTNVARVFKIAGLEPLFDIRPTLSAVSGAATFRRVQLLADGAAPAG